MGSVILTDHARQRYAERIMGYDSKNTVAQFVATHAEKIENDIAKMIKYGKVIYTGKSNSPKNMGKMIEVILNGTWILIRDANTKAVITLYNIDLGVEKVDNLSCDSAREMVCHLIGKQVL